MGASKYVVILLSVTLAGLTVAEQDQSAPPPQDLQRGSSAGQLGSDAEAVNLAGQRSELTRRAQALELDLAGIDARRKGLQAQGALMRDETSHRLNADVVTQELQKLLVSSEQNLAQLKKAAEAGRASVMDLTRAQESVGRARIDLARRREELTRLAGGGLLQGFIMKEQSRLAIDKAEKEAQLPVIRQQLDEVQKQLAQVAPLPLRTDAEAVNLTGQRSELTRRAQALELDLAGIDARRKALEEQMDLLLDEVNKRLDEDVMTQELQRLLATSEKNLTHIQKAAEAGRVPVADMARAQESVAKGRIELVRRQEELAHSAVGGQLEEFTYELNRLGIDRMWKGAQRQTVRRHLDEVHKQLAQVAPLPPRTDAEAVNLAGQRSELTRRAQALELDLAGLGARREALQEQIALLRDEVSKCLGEDVVLQELQRLVGTSEQNLAQAEKAAEAGRVSVVDLTRAQEGVAKARIDVARRREEVTRLAGGDLLQGFTKERSRLAIDKAEKEAQWQTIRQQIEEVQKQLTQALGGEGL